MAGVERAFKLVQPIEGCAASPPHEEGERPSKPFRLTWGGLKREGSFAQSGKRCQAKTAAVTLVGHRTGFSLDTGRR
jgi:hypothetical protein